MRAKEWLCVGLLCILFAGMAHASTTFNLSTGTATYNITSDTNGSPDGTGTAVDTTMPSASPYTHISPNLSDGTDTGVWVGPTATQATASCSGNCGTAVYTVTFNLTGYNLATASLIMTLGADDYVSTVVLNTTTIFTAAGTEITGGMWATGTSVGPITSGFITGLNTLTFTVPNNNLDNTGSCCGPTGLIVAADVTATSAVPEPGTLGTTGLCLAGLATLLRRRNSAPAR